MVVDRVSLLVSFSCDRSSHDVLGRCIYDATCKNHESVCVRACVCVWVCDKERNENDALLGDKKQTGKRDGRKRLISPRTASGYRGAKNIGHLKLYQKAAIQKLIEISRK